MSWTCAHTAHQHTSLLTCSLPEQRRGEKHPLQCVLQILCPELALCCSLQSWKMHLGMSFALHSAFGCVHNAAGHSPDPLLLSASPPTFLSTLPQGCTTDMFFCSQEIHDCIQLYWTCPTFWEHSLIWMKDTIHHQCSHHLLVVMYPKAPWRPIILCLLFQGLGKIYVKYLK